jgi:hypothetical protein
MLPPANIPPLDLGPSALQGIDNQNHGSISNLTENNPTMSEPNKENIANNNSF